VAPRLRWIHRSTGAQRRILAVQGVSRQHFLAASAKKQAPFFAHELILMTKEFHYFNFFNNLLAASSGCFF